MYRQTTPLEEDYNTYLIICNNTTCNVYTIMIMIPIT